MANLFDYLMNKVGNVNNTVQRGFSRLGDMLTNQQETPYIEPLQVDKSGNIDDLESKRLAIKQAHLAKPRTLAEHLFTGRTQETDMQNVNPETGETTLETIRTYQPSFFDNLTSGAKENFATGFAAPNLTDNTGEFGKKSAGYRIGEGIGTLGRFLESPLGRGLLVGGIVGASGGSGLEALGYGAGTTTGNQANRMRDRAYREQLEGMGVDTSNIRGYITDDVYKNIVSMKQLKDNADYRNALLETQQNNQLVSQQIAKDKLNYQMQQDKIKNAQEWAKINASENRANSKDDAKRKQSLSTLNMIDTALGVVANNPKAYGFWKGVAPNDVTNRADAEGVKARAVIDSVTAEYRKYLTGAQMSDKERKDYEKFLPNPRDNADIIRRKLQGMQMVIQAREGLFDYVADDTTPSINVDTNALEAEMRKRGLK